MKYASKRSFLRAGVAPIAVTLAFSFAVPAQAGWGHLRGGGSSGAYAAAYGSSGASSGGYAAAYGSSGGASSGYSAAYGSSGSYAAGYGSSGLVASSGGSSGRPGLLARLHAHMDAKRARHAARRAARASSGGSSGAYVASYGSSGYTGGSSGSAYTGGSSGSAAYRGGSSGTSVNYAPVYSVPVSHGSSGGSTGSVYYGASKQSPATAATFASAVVEDDTVQLTVAVPSEAKVFVNGRATTSKGTVRQFVSRGLKADKTYKFEIKAEMLAADGQPMTESRTVVVKAGETENLAFAFSEYNKPIETALTLHVPEGAEVSLGGNATKAVGDTRTYRTKQLKPGEIWDDYQVTVRLGDKVKQKSIRLLAGDKLEMSFAFDESISKLASR